MPTDWKLNGTKLEDLGVVVADLEFFNGDADVLSLAVRKKNAFSETPPLEFGDSALLTKHSPSETKWFRGEVTKITKSGSASGEGYDYEIKGPWHWLEEHPLKAGFKVLNPSPPPTLITATKSRVLLGYDSAGAEITTLQQVGDIIDFAVAAGAPFTKGSVPTTTLKWKTEVQDISCAEAIRQFLRWTPDIVVSWDYSGATPVMNLVRRSAATTVSKPCKGTGVESCSVRARNDLVPAGVTIHYETVDSSDGVLTKKTTNDVYPVGTEDDHRAIALTVDLEGFTSVTQSQDIGTESLPTTNNDAAKDWFKDQVQWLNDYDNDDLLLTVPDRTMVKILKGSESDPDNYPRQLTKGQVQDWMSGIKAAKIVVETTFKFKGTPTAASRKIFDAKDGSKKVSVAITATDATTKTYKGLGSFETPEPIPTGLAQAYYDALSTLQYEGRLSLVAQEVDGVVRPAKVLNLTGGESGWATMNAVVHSVRENLFNGATVVNFGPQAAVLRPHDWLELQRVNRRNPRTFRKAEEITSGEVSSDEIQGSVSSDSTDDLTEPSGGGEPRFKLTPENTTGSNFTVHFGEGSIFGKTGSQSMQLFTLDSTEDTGVTATTRYWIKVFWKFNETDQEWYVDKAVGKEPTFVTGATKPEDSIPDDPDDLDTGHTHHTWGEVTINGDKSYDIDQELQSDLVLLSPVVTLTTGYNPKSRLPSAPAGGAEIKYYNLCVDTDGSLSWGEDTGTGAA